MLLSMSIQVKYNRSSGHKENFLLFVTSFLFLFLILFLILWEKKNDCVFTKSVLTLALHISADGDVFNKALTNEDSPECSLVCGGGGAESTNLDPDPTGNSYCMSYSLWVLPSHIGLFLCFYVQVWGH